MKILGTKQSVENNVDIFGNIEPWNNDHIFPIAKGGTGCKENIIRLSKESNISKGNKTKGSINGIRYSVIRETNKQNTNKEQSIYGSLYIRTKDNKWYKVTNE